MSKRNRISKLQADFLVELELLHGNDWRECGNAGWRMRRMLKSLERQGRIELLRVAGQIASYRLIS